MVSVEMKLSGDLEAALDRLAAKVQDKVIMAGTAAAAKVIYDEVKLNVTPPRLGIKTGNLSESIYRVYSPEKSGEARKTYRISWNKTKAPHGHLIEFGTSRAPAHPFIRPAFDHIKEAMAAGMERMAKEMGNR
jgi:HK97 gp10 family phage protein